MPIVKYHGDRSPEQRIADRLKSSGDVDNADVVTSQGTGPTRVKHHLFHSGYNQRHMHGDESARVERETDPEDTMHHGD